MNPWAEHRHACGEKTDRGGFREPEALGALSCPFKSHDPSLPWAPFASRAHAEEMDSDAAGDPRPEKGRPPGP